MSRTNSARGRGPNTPGREVGDGRSGHGSRRGSTASAGGNVRNTTSPIMGASGGGASRNATPFSPGSAIAQLSARSTGSSVRGRDAYPNLAPTPRSASVGSSTSTSSNHAEKRVLFDQLQAVVVQLSQKAIEENKRIQTLEQKLAEYAMLTQDQDRMIEDLKGELAKASREKDEMAMELRAVRLDAANPTTSPSGGGGGAATESARLLIDELRKEKRQRIQVEEQGNRMIEEQQRTIDHLEERLRERGEFQRAGTPGRASTPVSMLPVTPKHQQQQQANTGNPQLQPSSPPQLYLQQKFANHPQVPPYSNGGGQVGVEHGGGSRNNTQERSASSPPHFMAPTVSSSAESTKGTGTWRSDSPSTMRDNGDGVVGTVEITAGSTSPARSVSPSTKQRLIRSPESDTRKFPSRVLDQIYQKHMKGFNTSSNGTASKNNTKLATEEPPQGPRDPPPQPFYYPSHVSRPTGSTSMSLGLLGSTVNKDSSNNKSHHLSGKAMHEGGESDESEAARQLRELMNDSTLRMEEDEKGFRTKEFEAQQLRSHSAMMRDALVSVYGRPGSGPDLSPKKRKPSAFRDTQLNNPIQ